MRLLFELRYDARLIVLYCADWIYFLEGSLIEQYVSVMIILIVKVAVDQIMSNLHFFTVFLVGSRDIISPLDILCDLDLHMSIYCQMIVMKIMHHVIAYTAFIIHRVTHNLNSVH